MKFVELTVTTTKEGEELVADVFWDYTDYGVAVCSYADVVELTLSRKNTFDYIDADLLDGDENVSLVKGYIPFDGAEQVKRSVMERLNALKSGNYLDFGSLEVVSRVVDGDDWIEVWKKHFKVIEFDKVAICPKWIEYHGDKKVVYIGSNMAFGTGEHETTSMCVKYLEKTVKTGQTVIDVGTGSGILGIVSAKLGAKKVYMSDNDEKAIECANLNVDLNGESAVCKPVLSNLLDDCSLLGDVVVANITADVLEILSSDILRLIKSYGGVLIMSGILNDKAEALIKRYECLGFELIDTTVKGEWTAVMMRLN